MGCSLVGFGVGSWGGLLAPYSRYSWLLWALDEARELEQALVFAEVMMAEGMVLVGVAWVWESGVRLPVWYWSATRFPVWLGGC